MLAMGDIDKISALAMTIGTFCVFSSPHPSTEDLPTSPLKLCHEIINPP
jgi:hypothetical protein